jgi:DNA (cytosine-5)-methyltransferase 1
LQRQQDGILPRFPIWDDIRTFDGKPWKGLADAVCGGFPCQDISSAGKGAGINGNKSGLWKEMARVIGEIQPRFIFIENSPLLRTRGLSVVLKDIAELGYDAKWGIVSASDCGAEHQRKRMWVFAYSNKAHRQGGSLSIRIQKKFATIGNIRWGKDKPGVDRMANGMAHRVDRLAAIGNGQVPAVVKMAWELLK